VRALRQSPIPALAAEELQRRRKAILKKGRHLETLDARRRHRLRIRAKKLRYASEFFTSAFPGGKSARRFEDFVERLAKLQDALGDLNDIAVHEELSVKLVNGNAIGEANRRRGKTKMAFAAGVLSGHEEARIGPLLKGAMRDYHRFAKEKPFWT
jgi:CHAD domain-containing protein